MYLGKLVEISPSEELYFKPVHPYTATLLAAVPIPDVHQERKPIARRVSLHHHSNHRQAVDSTLAVAADATMSGGGTAAGRVPGNDWLLAPDHLSTSMKAR